MKTNREFIDGIYQKAEQYESKKDTYEGQSPLRQRRYFQLPAACACAACIFLGIFLIKNTQFSQNSNNNEINEISYNPNTRTLSLNETEQVSSQVCIEMVEMLDTEMKCVIYNNMGSELKTGDIITIKTSEPEYRKLSNRFIATITETENGYEFISDETTSFYIYEKTVNKTDYYVSKSGEELTLPANQ